MLNTLNVEHRIINYKSSQSKNHLLQNVNSKKFNANCKALMNKKKRPTMCVMILKFKEEKGLQKPCKKSLREIMHEE
jgi:hypothetical protein